MRASGTEPGDFIEFDYDLIQAERRQRIRDVLTEARPKLEKETGAMLTVSNDGNDLVLSEDGEVRFRAALSSDGRVVITDLKSGNRL
jgi:hypothetical protein